MTAAAPRRMGSETSKTRAHLLDVAERLMVEEGYAAVGVRRVAREAEVAPALVLYYFRTLDDLFLAMLRRRAESELERAVRRLEGPRPLRALWQLTSHPGNTLTTEFAALANHRKTIRAELAGISERYREAQLEVLTRRIEETGVELPPGLTPAVLLVLANALGRNMMMEHTMGLTARHAETLAFVEDFLQDREGEPGTP
ncbi:TetR/AcrR family transcriptional regulator [Streptomyces sp. NBC_01016]|uniref:TetR/AcrR family transcriptional regulator n=1 Tax=Streptomyces sp. NBC_01016 TaxID=2903720 RepID=UPI002255CD34|nr:TetR/AcrR family transcriptional regulator [Streptomyces sp. NBC_01016]MCX4831338.1 TetR/AcrR family transcriptional regulator [Streptomyces sp. NBC_01016]